MTDEASTTDTAVAGGAGVEFRASPDRSGREHFEGLETLIAGGRMITRLSIVFSAGALGGLLNALLFWLFGLIGITALAGMATPVNRRGALAAQSRDP